MGLGYATEPCGDVIRLDRSQLVFELHPRPETFRAFQDAFLLAFRQPNYELMLDAQIRSRVQGANESAIKYCYDILALCAKLDPTMPDNKKIKHMFRGMRRDLMQRVFSFITPQSTANDVIARVRLECQSDSLIQSF